MLGLQFPLERRPRHQHVRAGILGVFILAACSLSVTAASPQATSSPQQTEAVPSVKKKRCYKLPPFTTKAEAKAAASNAEAQGSSAGVTQANGDWVVKICEK